MRDHSSEYDIDIYEDPVFAVKYAIRRHREEERAIRAAILALVDAGESQLGLARKLGMKPSTVNLWVSRAREERQSPGTTPPEAH